MKDKLPIPPWEQIIETILIRHPTNPTTPYILNRNKFGTYWLENDQGEGMDIRGKNMFKLWEFFNSLFEESF